MFAHSGFQFAHPVILSFLPPCPPQYTGTDIECGKIIQFGQDTKKLPTLTVLPAITRQPQYFAPENYLSLNKCSFLINKLYRALSTTERLYKLFIVYSKIQRLLHKLLTTILSLTNYCQEVFRPRLKFPGWATPTLNFSTVGACPRTLLPPCRRPCPSRVSGVKRRVMYFSKLFLSAMRRNSVLEELRVSRLANIQEEIRCNL